MVDVRGMSVAAARAALDKAGCKGRYRIYLDCAPTQRDIGRIVAQRPLAGILRPGRRILLARGAQDLAGCGNPGSGQAGGNLAAYNGDRDGQFRGDVTFRFTFRVQNGQIAGDIVGTIDAATGVANIAQTAGFRAVVACPDTELAFTRNGTARTPAGERITCTAGGRRATGTLSATRRP